MANILIIGYSQTGQLDSILDKIAEPLSSHTIERIKIKPKKDYPFPWSSNEFFEQMPECVLERPVDLAPIKFSQNQYDLIILGYQPWFLSPSLPITSLFYNADFCSLLKDTPVITVVGSRNMWLNSQKMLQRKIEEHGGFQIANIPLADKNHNLISAVTIMYWLFNGKKDSYMGLFPNPGISDKDIEESTDFGAIVNQSLQNNTFEKLQEDIVATGKISLTTTIIFIEERAKFFFRIWANLITNRGTTRKKRTLYVNFFKYYLVILLFVVSPLVLSLFFTLFYPFCANRFKRKRDFYLKGIIKAEHAGRIHYKNSEILTQRVGF